MWGDAFPFAGRNLVCLCELIGNYNVWEKASGPFFHCYNFVCLELEMEGLSQIGYLEVMSLYE